MRDVLGDAVFGVLLVIVAALVYLVVREWNLVWGMMFGR